MLYFIQTTRFIPIDYKKYGFKIIDEDTLILEEDESIWKSVLLYDLGWGREKGYYRTPILNAEQLFLMAFPNNFKHDFEERFNLWGSIAILLDNHCEFLLEKIIEELKKSKEFAIKHEEVLIYINSELNISENLIGRLSDKKLASNCKKWKQINNEFKVIK